VRHIRHSGFFALVCIVALATLVSLAGPAQADPIADKQAEAKALQDQIEASNRQITALGEQYNAAQLELEEAERDIAAAQASIDETKRKVRELKDLVRERAAEVYRRAITGESLRDLDYADAASLLKRRAYAESQADKDNDLLDRLASAKRRLAKQRAASEQARADADARRVQITAAKGEVEAATAQQQQLLGQVQGEIARLVEEERKRREQEALAAALERISAAAAAAADANNGVDLPNLPPPGPVAATAIEWGKSQLGKPYRYAGTGPDSYDCSGFTMMAYRAAGISLPHYSGAQYDSVPHVSLDAMLPGDLVFWGSGGSEHVAIYLGGGQIIEAGGDGDDVNIGPIWGRPSGAGRPA
jgi:cell wall-associated NlpC family hydrolase